MTRPIRRAIIGSRGKGSCRFALSSSIASDMGGNPMQISGGAQVMSATVDDGAPWQTWYASSAFKFNPSTAVPSWDNPRVMQTQLRRLDNGVAVFRVEGSTEFIEIFYDLESGTWTGVVNGSETEMVSEGFSGTILTFRMNQYREAELWVKDFLLASLHFTDTEFQYIAEWEAKDASDGDGFEAEVRGGVFMLDGMDYLAGGDHNWCGKDLQVIEVADDALGSFVASGSISLVQREEVVNQTQEANNDDAPGSFAATASLALVQREVAVDLNEVEESEESTGAFSATGDVIFVQREVVEQ